MRIIFLLFFIFIASGCTPGGQTHVQYSGIDESDWPENKELPNRPDENQIPDEDDWVEPIFEGDVADRDGIIMSPEKAVRARQWQVGYESLFDIYSIDREIWEQHRIIYETRIRSANEEIRRLAPTWWDENSLYIGMSSGFVAGVATAITIFYISN